MQHNMVCKTIELKIIDKTWPELGKNFKGQFKCQLQGLENVLNTTVS